MGRECLTACILSKSSLALALTLSLALCVLVQRMFSHTSALAVWRNSCFRLFIRFRLPPSCVLQCVVSVIAAAAPCSWSCSWSRCFLVHSLAFALIFNSLHSFRRSLEKIVNHLKKEPQNYSNKKAEQKVNSFM